MTVIRKYETIMNASFILMLMMSVFSLWRLDVFPTEDGPAHLYNAGLLHFYHGSPFLHSYLKLNPFYLPNSLSHYILSCLLILSEPPVAEKIFLTIFILLFA